MAKKNELKGIRLKDDLVDWFDEQENGSASTREAIKNQIKLEEENIDLNEAINIYNKLEEEFEENISLHLKRAIKVYNQ